MANKYIRFGADLFNNGDKTFYLGEDIKRWKEAYIDNNIATKFTLTDGATPPTVPANKAYLQWNSTDSSIDFIFN